MKTMTQEEAVKRILEIADSYKLKRLAEKDREEIKAQYIPKGK